MVILRNQAILNTNAAVVMSVHTQEPNEYHELYKTYRRSDQACTDTRGRSIMTSRVPFQEVLLIFINKFSCMLNTNYIPHIQIKYEPASYKIIITWDRPDEINTKLKM
jgi:hypothetical protein